MVDELQGFLGVRVDGVMLAFEDYGGELGVVELLLEAGLGVFDHVVGNSVDLRDTSQGIGVLHFFVLDRSFLIEVRGQSLC